MTLRMEQVLPQLPGMVARWREQLRGMEAGLRAAEAVLAGWATDPAAGDAAIRAAMARSAEPFAVASEESPGYVAPAPPFRPVTVVSADGSSIEPDRFAAVQCYVVNTGFVVLPYGTSLAADLGSHSELGPQALEAEGEDDTGAEDAGPRAWGVSLRRDVRELETGAQLAEGLSGQGPVVLLLDGTLFPWDLDSRQVAAATRDELTRRTSNALDRLAACGDSLSIGAYVSGSRSSDVVNSLRALAGADGRSWPGSDGHLFARRLGDGERSAVFRAASERVRNVESLFANRHEVCFFYLRVGDDVARVELPQWAMAVDRVARLHATVVDQCRRCDGYPRSLQEAHEQAVISMGDREVFGRMLEAEASRQGLRTAGNGKQASKRRRGL